MRMPFEQLVELAGSLDDEDAETSLGKLARRWNEDVLRIADAIDVLRMLSEERTYAGIPASPRFSPWAALWRIMRMALALAFFAWLIWLLATHHAGSGTC